MSLLDKKRIRQTKVLHFIYAYSQEKGYPPTVQEIASNITIYSYSTLYLTIKDLCEQGFLSMIPYKNRSIVLTDKGKHFVKNSTDSAFFTFQITDDSLSGAGILQGDTVTAEKDKKAQEGDLVVVAFMNNILCRRFSEEEGIGFYPDNPAYPVLKPTPQTYCQILGVVQSLQRDYQNNLSVCERGSACS